MEKGKKESKLRAKIEEMKKTPKGKAILKLIGWAIFFFVLFIFIIFTSFGRKTTNNLNTPTSNSGENKENINKEEEETPPAEKILSEETFGKLKEQYLNGSYKYQYNITIGDNKYLFNGEKNLENETGYKDTVNGTIKYYIDSTGIYEDKLNTKTPISNLYENLDNRFMNRNELMNFLENIEFNLISEEEVLVYHMASEIEDYKLTLKDNFLRKIEISRMATTDNVGFTYIIEIDNIEE